MGNLMKREGENLDDGYPWPELLEILEIAADIGKSAILRKGAKKFEAS